MKKYILGCLCALIAMTSCDDTIGSIGSSIQPESDQVIVYSDTFQIQASTIKLDSIYARTTSGLLGQIYDPLFGNLKSDYLCQFYCPSEYEFEYEPIDGKIDSVSFEIAYLHTSDVRGWLGDSLAPMKAEIFAAVRDIDKNYYTNVDPAEYCDLQTSLASKSYSAYDPSIPDSVRMSDSFYPAINFDLDDEIGQRIYDATKNNPEVFKDQESFNKFFPGFYVTTTFGTGNILQVQTSMLKIHYRHMLKDVNDADSLAYATEFFSVTREVVQLNQIKNENLDELLNTQDTVAYVKSPSGVCTKLVIPTQMMEETLKGRIINEMPLTLNAFPQPDWDHSFNATPYLLLIPEDSVKNFFEEQRMYDGRTSYIATLPGTGDLSYPFNNIASVIQDHIEKDPKNDLRLLVLPVSIFTNSETGATSTISHQMVPSALSFRLGEFYKKMIITSSRFNEE